MVPLVNRTFEWGVVIAAFLSVLSIVPRRCARLAYFLHPKLRKISEVLITPRLLTLPLRRLRCAGSICHASEATCQAYHSSHPTSCLTDSSFHSPPFTRHSMPHNPMLHAVFHMPLCLFPCLVPQPSRRFLSPCSHPNQHPLGHQKRHPFCNEVARRLWPPVAPMRTTNHFAGKNWVVRARSGGLSR